MCEFEKNKRAIYLIERNFLHRKKFFEEDLQEDVFSIKTPQWILDDPDYGQRRYGKQYGTMYYRMHAEKVFSALQTTSRLLWSIRF